MNRYLLLIFVITGVLADAFCTAAATTPASDAASDMAAAGRILLGEMNCTACHAASVDQAAWVTRKAAPRLNDIGNRLSPEWIAGYLADPQNSSPGVTMPNLLGTLPEADRPKAAEALTHYLLSQSPPKARPQLPDRSAVKRGETLYHKLGCVACHAPQDGKTPPLNSLPLNNLADKWRLDGLQRFLHDPLSVRPSGRMPSMNLTDAEASDVAHFLLRQTRTSATLEVAHYRAPVNNFEAIGSLEPMRTGPASSLSLAGAGNDRGGVLRFSGYLLIDQPGDYTLFLTAIGASRLAVDGKWLLGQESWDRQQVSERSQLRLQSGPHAITLDYVQRRQKEPALMVEWEGPGIARAAIPSARLRATKHPVAESPEFIVDANKAARGGALYAEFNCAACHEGKLPAAAPPSLAEMNPARGCLSETPAARSPDFHLTPAQRRSLLASVGDLHRPNLPAPSAPQQVRHALATFRCAACHARDGVGGVPADRDAYFTSAGEDLGDEGRLPPSLDGVGHKLRAGAIEDILFKAAAVRSYLNTRMPQFGQRNVGQLPALFAALDRRDKKLAPSSDPPETQREIGRTLVGTNGLSCIACHQFNRQPAQSMQVVDLISMAGRLNEDWFREFLIDPNRFHPGTRMPSFWPEGKSPLPKILDGDTGRQQAAIWTYLSDAEQAKFPVGLGRQNVELVVGGEAVVYRGKLWEAGFRAIATGYPGQLNLAFDAEEGRLALLWRGRFLNAGPHWTVQGMGQIHPLGTQVIVFPHGTALAILADAAAPWPQTSPRELGMKFHGYQLDSSNQPTLLYAFKDRQIEDLVTPMEGKNPALHRAITFVDAPVEHLYLRLAVGRLQAAGERAWRLNDSLTISVNGGSASVRGQGDQRELIVAVPAGKKGHRLEVDYAW